MTATAWPAPRAPAPARCPAWAAEAAAGAASEAGAAVSAASWPRCPRPPSCWRRSRQLPPADRRPQGRPGRGPGRRPRLLAAQAAAPVPPGAAARPAAGRRRHRGRAGAAGADPRRRGPGHPGAARCRRSSGSRSRRWPSWSCDTVVNVCQYPGHRPHRRAPAVRAAGEGVRAVAAPGSGLLRARAVRADHDPDDHRRGRAVHVPADRSAAGGRQRPVLRRHRGGAGGDRLADGADRAERPAAAADRDRGVPRPSPARPTPRPARRSRRSTPTCRRTSRACG